MWPWTGRSPAPSVQPSFWPHSEVTSLLHPDLKEDIQTLGTITFKKERKIYHDECFHLVSSVAHMLHPEMTETFVKEAALLLPHFPLDIDDAFTKQVGGYRDGISKIKIQTRTYHIHRGVS